MASEELAGVGMRMVCFSVLLELSWCQDLQRILKGKDKMYLPWTRTSGHGLSGNLFQNKG